MKIISRATIDPLFVVALLTLFSLQRPGTIFLAYLLPLVYLLAAREDYKVRKSSLALISLVILLCLPAASSMNHNVTPLFYLLLSPFLCLAAYRIGSSPLPHVKRVISTSYWLFSSAIMIGAALHWDAAEPLGEIIPGASQNGLPSYLIVLLVAYLIAAYADTGKLPIFPSVVTLAIALIGLGRGSIIVAFSIICFSVLVNFLSGNNKNRRAIFIFSFLILLPFLVFVFSTEIERIYEEIYYSTRLSQGFLDEHRGRMLSDYVQKLDGSAWLLGAPYYGTSILTNYGGNPHNSFIRLHSFYGIFGFLILLAPLSFAVLANKKKKDKFIVLSLIFFVLIRAATEPIFFPSALDFFYLIYFVIFFKHYTLGNQSNHYHVPSH